MTAEEVLKLMSVDADDVCVIDPETRVIQVPEKNRILGVVSDEKAERIYFQCPKIVGDNIDLSSLGLRVNYQNANGDKDAYVIDDVKISGDNITFSWLLSRKVTMYKGVVSFIICAVKTGSDGKISNEWNTTLNKDYTVLEGLEVTDEDISEEEAEIIQQLIAQSMEKLTEMSVAIDNAKTATATANTAAEEAKSRVDAAITQAQQNVDTAIENAETATVNANEAAGKVFDESYILTTDHTFGHSDKVEPTAHGNALVQEIDGATYQRTTTGKNLFNINGNVNTKGHDYSQTDKNIVSGNVLTCNVDGNSYNAVGQVIYGIKGKTVTISAKIISKGSAYSAGIYIYENGTHNNTYVLSGTLGVISLKYTVTTENPVFAFVARGGIGAQFTDIQLEIGETKTEYEPYTGGKPGPNPEYPLEIHGVGENGYFDGEVLQVGINSGTGAHNTSEQTHALSSANYISCKPGDNVVLSYTKEMEYIEIFEYDGNYKYVKPNVGKNTNKVECVCGDTTSFIMFDVREKANIALPKANVKNISLTINGKPNAIKLKSAGLNLYPYESSKYNVTVFKSPMFDWTKKKIVYFSIDSKTDCADGQTGITIVYYDKNGNLLGGNGYAFESGNSFMHRNASFDGSGAAGNGASIDLTEVDKMNIRISYYSSTETEVSFKNLMISDEPLTGKEYVPYQGSEVTIPLSAPLYDGDKIVKVNGEYKVYRENKAVVLNGEEIWNTYQGTPAGAYCYFLELDEPKITAAKIGYQTSLCDRFINKNASWANADAGKYSDHSDNVRKYFVTDKPTLEAWKTWLSENPVTLVYKLDQSYYEDLPQEPFYNLTAADEFTSVSLPGNHEKLDMHNVITFPRNEDGALATTGYAVAKKNAEIIKDMQTLNERILALEQLALDRTT